MTLFLALFGVVAREGLREKRYIQGIATLIATPRCDEIGLRKKVGLSKCPSMIWYPNDSSQRSNDVIIEQT